MTDIESQDREKAMLEALEAVDVIIRDGRLRDAIPMLHALSQTYPDGILVWWSLAYNLQLAGFIRESIPCYERVLELCPTHGEAVIRLGDCHFYLGETAKAHELFLSIAGAPNDARKDVIYKTLVTAPVKQRLSHFLCAIGDLIREDRLSHQGLWRIAKEWLSLLYDSGGVRHSGFNSFLRYLELRYLQPDSAPVPSPVCDLCGSHRFRTVFYFEDHRAIKCRSCGLERQDYIPPDGWDVELGTYEQDLTIKVFEQVWKNSQIFNIKTSRLREMFAGAGEVFPKPGGSFLEIGCGEGHLLEYLKEHGMEVEGTETSMALVNHCRARRLNVSKNTVSGLDDGPPRYDCFAAYHVLEHLDKPSLMFSKAWSLLKPGGFLFLEMPTPDLTKLSFAAQSEPSYGYCSLYHVHFNQKEIIHKYCEKYGFKVVNSFEYLIGVHSCGGFLAQKQ